MGSIRHGIESSWDLVSIGSIQHGVESSWDRVITGSGRYGIALLHAVPPRSTCTTRPHIYQVSRVLVSLGDTVKEKEPMYELEDE